MFRSSSKLLRYWMKKDPAVAKLMDEICNLQFPPLATQEQVTEIIKNKIKQAADAGVKMAHAKWMLGAAITVRWQIISERIKNKLSSAESSPDTIRLATGDVYLWEGDRKQVPVSKKMSITLEEGDVIFVGPTLDKLPTRVYHNGLFVSDPAELLATDNKNKMRFLGIKTPEEYTILVNSINTVR